MRNIVVFCLTFFLSLYSVHGEFKVIAPHLATILAGVSFFDENTGLVAGAADGVGPVVLRTTNGGLNWTNVNHGLDALMFLDVSALKSNAFAAGVGLVKASASVFSNDAGLTWNKSKELHLFQAIQNVGHISERRPFAVGQWFSTKANDGVLKSLDGGLLLDGNDWNQISDARYGSFLDDQNGFVSGGQFPNNNSSFLLSKGVYRFNHHLTFAQRKLVFTPREARKTEAGLNNTYAAVVAKTSDGGKTWTTLFQHVGNAQSGFYFNGISFVDSQHGWLVGEGTNNSTGQDFAFIWATSNGGLNWTQQLLVDNGGSLIQIRMLNAQEGWAVGALITRFGFKGQFWHTTNGGQTWALDSTVTDNYPLNLWAVNSQSVFAVAADLSGVSSVLKYFPN